MQITKVEKLTNQKWLNLFVAHYEHNGHQGRWEYASRKQTPGQGQRADAVVMVPILHEPGHPPRLVMIREFRIPINDYSLAFPAGLLEEGESIEECVRRELLEETALEVTRFRRISPPLYSSTGLTDESAVMAFVDVQINPDATVKHEPSEVIELRLLEFDEVSQLCDHPGAAFDAKAWCTLHMFQRLGRLD